MEELQKSLISKGCSLLSVSGLVLLLWLSFTIKASMAKAPAPPQIRVGVILDLNSTLGCMLYGSLTLALENHNNERISDLDIHLKVQNVPQTDVVAAADAADDLIEKEKVRAILGPQNSEQARYILELGKKSQVPVIWFPITGPSLLPPPSPSSIYSDYNKDIINNCFQFRAIAEVIQALGWQSIVPIYEETEYGSLLIPCISNVFKEMSIQMVNITSVSHDSDIDSIIRKLINLPTHVFLVHMSIDLGTRFITIAQNESYNMMDEGYAWILTQELSSLTNPLVNGTRGRPLKGFMQGALGVRPSEPEKTWFRRDTEDNFDKTFNCSLTVYGWWAYHTMEALAMAFEKVGTDNDGTKLDKEIRAAHFTVYSGVHFNLSKGYLDQSMYEVYNVIGTRERIIGYWSNKTGLVQNLTKPDDKITDHEYKLKDPLWPGDTLDKPPKLSIGVPTTNSSPEFVSVDQYNSNKTQIYGFAITVFLKAVDVLPFRLNNYDFLPLPPMNYDDLLCGERMKNGSVDAIIGDITIVEKRANCVDFTLPYLESSVAMMVKVKDASPSKVILFKPFNLSLWLNLGGIFVAATIIIIILESYKPNDEINKQFRRNPFLVYKIDVMDEFQSRAAGWLVILTSFLFILILQVYTANLTSILVQGKTRVPLFKDEKEVKSSNLRVGYRNGSWVRELLIEQIGFHSSLLNPLRNHEEYNEALSNGSVVAIFDETPYLRLFLSKYKSSFMLTGPIYKTGGFAFAFPKKNGLSSHFSTAILKVTQDPEAYRMLMAKSSLPTSIEDLYFEDQNDTKTSSSLNMNNFGGIIRVVLSIVALFICFLIPLVIINFQKPSSSMIKWVRSKKFLSK